MALPSEFSNSEGWLSVIKRRIMEGMNLINMTSVLTDGMDLKDFLLTGNCLLLEAPKRPQADSPKFTRLSLKEKDWLVNYLASPFDAYFSSSMEDRMNPYFDIVPSTFVYCRDQLKKIVTKLRSRKDQISFPFSTCNYYEFGCEDRFNIIHCFDMVERVGLANFLPPVRSLLLHEDLNAILVTEITSKQRPQLSKPTKFVEASLHCPISMIPTLYGFRLANHLDLGSPVPIKFHDNFSVGSIKLQWHRAPSFSTNIKLGFSVDLIRAIVRLAKSCFISSYNPKPVSYQVLWPYSPLTFFNLVHSLAERHACIRDYATSHEGASSLNFVLVSPFYQPVWKTFKDMMHEVRLPVRS